MKTSDENLTVKLGPAWFIENQPVMFKPGDKVTVRGSLHWYKNQLCFVAVSLKRGDRILRLRNDDGHPFLNVWGRG